MANGDTSLPLVGLIAQALGQLARFGQVTAELAGAEVQSGLTGILRGIVFGIVAGAIFLLALVFLGLGLVHAIIAAGVAPDMAFFAVGAGLLVLCAILLLIARAAIKNASFLPRRALAELQNTLNKVSETTPHA